MLSAAPLTPAGAMTVDGLVSDWGVTPGTYGGSDWTPGTGINFAVEDQNPAVDFLSPGYGGQKFDVEALYFTRDQQVAYFAVVTGFPLEGRFYQGQNYYAGDFAIDFGSDGSYEFGLETTGANQGKLYGSPTWINPLFAVCGPFNLADGTVLGAADFAYDTTTYTPLASGQHYVFEFGIPVWMFGAAWGPDYIPQFSARWTMSCGNDCLSLNVARVPAVPEPSTAVLLAGAFLLFALVRFRKTACVKSSK